MVEKVLKIISDSRSSSSEKAGGQFKAGRWIFRQNRVEGPPYESTGQRVRTDGGTGEGSAGRRGAKEEGGGGRGGKKETAEGGRDENARFEIGGLEEPS